MAGFVDRVVGAARLDAKVYEEVEADRSAMGQAMAVVAAAALAAGIGSAGAGATGAVTAVVAGIVGWFLWAVVTWLVGTKLLPEPGTSADLGQMLRTIGFSAAPGLLNVLGIIPLLGWLAWIVALVWQLAAMVVAVRQALDYRTTGRAVLVCFIGFVFYVAVTTGFALMMGIGRIVLGG
jgi:hypothetical protein